MKSTLETPVYTSHVEHRPPEGGAPPRIVIHIGRDRGDLASLELTEGEALDFSYALTSALRELTRGAAMSSLGHELEQTSPGVEIEIDSEINSALVTLSTTLRGVSTARLEITIGDENADASSSAGVELTLPQLRRLARAFDHAAAALDEAARAAAREAAR